LTVFTEVDYKLLQLMADGCFHSGTSLGEALGISRAAVWQRMQKLQAYDLSFDAVTGRGYRLARPLDLLDSDVIQAGLDPATRKMLGRLLILPLIDSTNSYLRECVPVDALGTVCLAECQSGGRGRLGRHWVSPFAANIYLSIAWRYAHGTARLAGFSLAVAVAVVRALQALGVTNAGIKWPNDILIGGRKLAGVLVEASGETHGPCRVVIGVGLNVRMPDKSASLIDQAWIDLEQCGIDVPRNAVAAQLICQLFAMAQEYTREGFEAFQTSWQQLDVANGKAILVREHDRETAGIGRGIDSMGLLLVEHAGEIRRYASGDISLRVGDETVIG
jgi:BirA family transcriptional regulator, biotin operon repressor / biotin---[acetyl-CoA-carboxylase] ligase